MNPYHHELWDYNIGVAEELVKMGFGEIQFDYIRFPEPYPSCRRRFSRTTRASPSRTCSRRSSRRRNARLDKLGVRTTADIFGLVTTVRGPLEVGQQWEKLAPNIDVLLPMVYPVALPARVLGHREAERRAVQDDQDLARLGADARRRSWASRRRSTCVPGSRPSRSAKPRVRAAEQIKAQKKAAYDAGYDGWVMWSPGVEVRAVHSRAREDARVAKEEMSRRVSARVGWFS